MLDSTHWIGGSWQVLQTSSQTGKTPWSHRFSYTHPGIIGSPQSFQPGSQLGHTSGPQL